MKLLGIDCGSAYFKGVVLEQGRVLYSFYKKETGDWEAAREFLTTLYEMFPDGRFRVGVSGFEGGNFLRVNEIIALSTGVAFLHPGARSIIEIGAQTSKFVILHRGRVKEFSTNELCAAGTGSFIEQQAKRLHLSVEELSTLALKARRAAKIAGRCSVFAKSDMIHLQQKGTPLEEIAYGLCMAIARNSWTSLIKGRDFDSPLVIAGGCARNRGIIRSFSQVLRLKTGDGIIPSRLPGLETAVGSALEAGKKQAPVLSLKQVEEEILRTIERRRTSVFALRKPLPQVDVERVEEPQEVFHEPKSGYLGIDVGSVSTDFAVLDEEGRLISSVYLPTRGRPVEVILQGLSMLRERFRGGLEVLGCGTTGSGRYLAEKLVGADVVKNEITCQVLGTLHFFRDVDTIFEIGGQDSKYIYLRNGKIEDFTMNKICAAGTGSFLQEQSQQLGIDIYRDFSPLAFSSRRPVSLNSRCTVFMEAEVSSAVKMGIPTKDICAGLAYAIAENYLEKVVERRKIGKKISFQGGVASNRAVVAAFKALLGRDIRVHPYNRLSGAIGAALAAKLYKEKGKSKFRGFDIEVDPRIKTFECKACPNYCEVSLIKIGGEKVFFGDACERFSSRKSLDKLPASLAEYYINSYEAYFPSGKAPKGKVGIPRASSLMGFMPFWAVFFSELGFQSVLSPHSNEEILTKGVKNLPVGACLPVKLTAGHAAWLVERETDLIFLPAVVTLPGDEPSLSYGCPYTQSIPFMVKLNPENFLSPVVRMDGGWKEFAKGFEKHLPVLSATKEDLRRAYEKALKAQEEFEQKIKQKGREVLSEGGLKFAVLGRPYNLYDAYLNLNLFTHLQKLSVQALPLHFLPFELSGEGKLPWKFASDIIKAAERLRDMDGVYPIIVSNFGCGPDAFMAKILEEVLGEKPYLFLEFDEHRGEAGLITRLEAFMDRVMAGEERRGRVTVVMGGQRKGVELKGKKIYLPYFADHAYAFSGALKFAGYQAEVLPPGDEETRRLGEYYSSGKECHAYSELLGDLVRLSEREKEPAVYFFPGTKIPCLLNQYGNGMRLFLKSRGIKNIEIFTPFTEDFIRAVGMEGAERFYKGVLAIDILVKASCEIRPYEKRKGETDRIHRENLLKIEKAIAEGDILESLERALENLHGLKKEGSPKRPLVGIAGDIYTRINPYANNDLFHYLEERGLEVCFSL